jgi:hypothetical protein
VEVNGWIVQEWPHSKALGERWIAFPPQTAPDKPWPGLKFFASRDDAEAFVAASTD